jgi:pimeloyl-ACP methyl ester carboxylesterase
VYRRDGIGAELVTVWSVPRDGSVSMEIAYHPATVLLSFDGASDQELLRTTRARLDIYDPYQQRAVPIQGEQIALAGNFTSPYGLWLARSKFNAEALRTLFGHKAALDHAEVLMMQPYDPARLTVVLIHGLGASPDSWVNVANEILGDERLRDRYQVWQVFYPSNLPVAVSQRQVREALERTFALVDPQHVNVASHHVVLVGHSMGGIISRLLVSTGSERIWEERYQAPAGSERRQSLARLEPYLDFRPLPGVDCAVFLATPHAGTPYAHNWLGRRIASLVRLPATLIESVDNDAAAIEGELPEVAQILRRHPNAINQLDSSNPYFEIIGKLDIAPGVTYHQIIARKDPRVPLEQSDDGYVPYRSAYLPGAASTLVVESGHRVQLTAPAILELRRIMLEHSAANQLMDPQASVASRGQ